MKLKIIIPVGLLVLAALVVMLFHPFGIGSQSQAQAVSTATAEATASPRSEPTTSADPACKPLTDPFTQEVLKFEQASYLVDPAARAAAFKGIATPGYIAANPHPAFDHGKDIYVLVVPDGSCVNWKQDSTGKVRVVTAQNNIKTFRPGHVLVNGPFKDQPHTSTWALVAPGAWEAETIELG